jgi:hypothetical protein
VSIWTWLYLFDELEILIGQDGAERGHFKLRHEQKAKTGDNALGLHSMAYL